MFAHDGDEFVFADFARAEGVDGDGSGLGDADGVGNLNLALGRQTGGHDVFRYITASIGSGTVYFARVFAGERAAAMRGCTAVGIDNDFAAGEPAVALRPADHEAAGGVDEVFGVGGEHFGRQHGFDDVLNHGLAQFFMADRRIVLGGKHHGVDAFYFAGFAVVHGGNLRFGIGAQPRQLAAFAQFALALHQAVAVIDGKGHQGGGFVAGIAEHQALVARALVQVDTFAFVHALGDVG